MKAVAEVIVLYRNSDLNPAVVFFPVGNFPRCICWGDLYAGSYGLLPRFLPSFPRGQGSVSGTP